VISFSISYELLYVYEMNRVKGAGREGGIGESIAERAHREV
jgi:hypothetical protein